MRPYYTLGCVVWAVLAGAHTAPAEDAGEGGRLARAAAYLDEQREHQRIPGLSAAIVVDNKPVWSRGFGMADLENDIPATPETVYRIASVSQTITAVALLQLVQSGRLSLTASVRDYVPELADQGELITIRHVLAHLSGIRHFKDAEEYFNYKHYRQLADTVEVFKDDRLVGKPNERFVLSTWGYNLLGLVIERVSSLSFGEYLRQHVFEPAGMKASGLDDPHAIIPHRARGYTGTNGQPIRNSKSVDLSVRYPGEGVLSTADDLARFAVAFNTGKLLDESLIRVMTTEHQTSSGKPTHYGLGCFVRELEGRKIVGHAGAVPQAAAILLIVPDEKLAVIILANLEQADVKTMGLEVARIMLTPELGPGS
ncbi:MAG: beta-lactamase family protein [Phycisphaerales bacterium]|nr:MAG: beta-lactamase family protein [Phycisphaerales bacterium]